MKANAAPASVADYCEDMESEKTVVNRDYQRDEGVWSTYARSYFIESVILGYPIPKLFLYVKFDLKTRRSHKEIVDGQQRSHALHQFYKNKLRLSSRISTESLRGKKYKDLTDEEQSAFLAYSLSIDEFIQVGEDEIRESFTRMNANNVALNSEELRNAKFQGDFKWFIVDISKIYRENLITAGVLSRRDIIRMSDTTMYSDIIYIIENGFETTKATQIDALYKKYDGSFPDRTTYSRMLDDAIQRWRAVDNGNFSKLARKHIFYTYIAAIALMEDGTAFSNLTDDQAARFEQIRGMEFGLSELNNSLENENLDPRLSDFVASCSVKTNVGSEKLIRFAYLYRALELT